MDDIDPQSADDLTLAGDFPDPDMSTWRALVDKTLAGKPYEKLSRKTYDGLEIAPLYTRSDRPGEGDPSGLPGAAPYTRGWSAGGAVEGGWDVRSLIAHPDPETANTQILEELEKGATSIQLRLDPSGKNGTIVRCMADLKLVLDGVYLDLAPLVLEPNGPSLPPAAYLIAYLEESGVAADTFIGNFGVDPLSTLAAVGSVIVPKDILLARMADLTITCARTFPKARALMISTAAYHNAGCSEAQELAFAMATAVDYLRHITAAGATVDEACRQVAFSLTCDADIFPTVAKLRAARRLWARIAEACGSSNAYAPLHAITAPRMFSRRDPWVNMLRSTAACFAAGVGGADAITVLPYESALGHPTAFGRRIARNTQLVLMEESSIHRVVDPAGGAWMQESLTDRMAEKAWALFQEIEAKGGMTEALMNGAVAAMIAPVAEARMKAIASRKDPLTGVSEFPNIDEKPVQIDVPDMDAIRKSADARAEAAKGKVEALPDAADGSLMDGLVAAAKADASSAAIGAALKGEPTKLTPLPQGRLAEDYEALRDAAEAWAETYGQAPTVYLACIGRVADFTARATFAKNLYEAGGVKAVTGAGGTDAAAIAEDFAKSGAGLAVLCSDDSVYAEHAMSVAKALADAGAGRITLAGRPGDHEAAYKEVGITGYIYLGCDVLAVLKDAHATLGAAS